MQSADRTTTTTRMRTRMSTRMKRKWGRTCGATRRFKSWEFARQPQKTCTQIIYNKNAKLSTRTQYRCTYEQKQIHWKKGWRSSDMSKIKNSRLSREPKKHAQQAAITTTSGETNGINDRWNGRGEERTSCMCARVFVCVCVLVLRTKVSNEFWSGIGI